MKNSGASFGINFLGLNLVIIVFLIILFVVWRRDKNVGWLVMIAGGVLNLVERLVFGVVTDYWKIPFTNVYNNLNDYLIFMGGIIVIWKKWQSRK